MLSSYVISGIARRNDRDFPAVGVFFTNEAPDFSRLNELGFVDIQEMKQVKQISKQPIQPTLYIFENMLQRNQVEIFGFDYEGKMVNRVIAQGEPHMLIPPVEGPAADKFLYSPRAYAILAQVKEFGRPSPVGAVLFVKPKPNESTLCPNKKVLNALGLVDIQRVEEVRTPAPIAENALYVFERPSCRSVKISSLDASGKVNVTQEQIGDPESIIPAINGGASEWLFKRNSIRPSDFPARRSSIPPGTEKIRR